MNLNMGGIYPYHSFASHEDSINNGSIGLCTAYQKEHIGILIVDGFTDLLFCCF